jgi:hypothetical protein
MLRSNVHLLLHLLVPALVACTFFRKQFLRAWLTMMAAMLIDLDHLLAEPIYDPSRCSIGFHPLHQVPAIAVYALMLLWRPLRLLAIGLLIHIILDGIDCTWIHLES